MTKRDGPRRASKRLTNPHISASRTSSPSTLDGHRRSKGRARTRASGVKIIDDPMQYEKRLKDQLTQMGFYAVNTLGDGNCLFRALSDQIYGSPNRHLEIRQQVCAYLAQHENRYKAFVDMDEAESWESHLQLMAKQGTYGGHLELSAFANYHRRCIKIIQPGMVYVISYEDESPGSSSLEKTVKGKQKGKGKRTQDSAPTMCSPETPVYLVYHQWEHYSSVRNLDGPHSGIPCIRERNMESSACMDEQGSEETGRRSQVGKIRKASMLSYRECSSSPVSAGSSSTTTTSTEVSMSSSSASPEATRTMAEAQDLSSTPPQQRPGSSKKSALNTSSTLSSKPNPSSTSNHKPLSKRALRLARRNHILPAPSTISPGHIDSVDLLKELQV